MVTPAAAMGNMDRGMGSFARTRVSWLCNPHSILNLSTSFACKFIGMFVLFLLFFMLLPCRNISGLGVGGWLGPELLKLHSLKEL